MQHPLLVFRPLCAYMRMFLLVFIWVYIHTSTGAHRDWERVSVVLYHYPLIWDLVLSKSGVHILLAMLELNILTILQSVFFSVMTTGFLRMPTVVLEYWDLYSGPHDCSASTLKILGPIADTLNYTCTQFAYLLWNWVCLCSSDC